MVDASFASVKTACDKISCRFLFFLKIALDPIRYICTVIVDASIGPRKGCQVGRFFEWKAINLMVFPRKIILPFGVPGPCGLEALVR